MPPCLDPIACEAVEVWFLLCLDPQLGLGCWRLPDATTNISQHVLKFDLGFPAGPTVLEAPKRDVLAFTVSTKPECEHPSALALPFDHLAGCFTRHAASFGVRG